MRVKNKETGETYKRTMPIVFNIKTSGGGEHTVSCKSIAELNEEWEDVPTEEVWYLGERIGNHSMPKEEAKKVTEKILAWKRLKDKGFRFTGWDAEPNSLIILTAYEGQVKNIEEDLDLIFGGEE